MDESDQCIATLYVGAVRSSDSWTADSAEDAVNAVLEHVGMPVEALHRLGVVLDVLVYVAVRHGARRRVYRTTSDGWQEEGGVS